MVLAHLGFCTNALFVKIAYKRQVVYVSDSSDQDLPNHSSQIVIKIVGEHSIFFNFLSVALPTHMNCGRFTVYQ